MTEERINSIENEINLLKERLLKLETLFSSEGNKVIQTKKVSVKEYILEKSPKNNLEKTLAIAYFLEKNENFSSFNYKDIEDAFKKAKEQPPKDNVAYNLFTGAKKGYLMETDEKKDKLKAFTLTNSGEKFVEGNFRKE